MKQVDCADVRDAFRAGTVPADPEVDAHVRDCVRCAELFADEARLGKALANEIGLSAPGDELWLSIEGAVRAERGPRAWLRSRPTNQRLMFAVVAALAAVGLAAVRLRTDWAAYPSSSLSAWVGVYAVGVFAALLLMLAPLGKPQPPRWAVAGLGMVVLALPFAYALGLLAPVVHAADSASTEEILKRAARCFAFGLALSLPFLALTFALERTDRVPPRRLVLAGASSGLIANLALLVHCPLNDQAHLLVGHAPIGFATFLILLAASRWTTRRAS